MGDICLYNNKSIKRKINIIYSFNFYSLILVIFLTRIKTSSILPLNSTFSNIYIKVIGRGNKQILGYGFQHYPEEIYINGVM